MKEIVLNIKGMMCEGCEKRVQNVLGNIDGVESVNANHNTGKVLIVLNKDVEKLLLEEAIDDLGYEVIKEG